MVDNKLLNNYFIGIVEDNEDPEKKQRIRVRIPFIHGKVDEIPTDSLPWCKPSRDLDGKSYSIPDINKIVSVTFPTGNPYLPVYQESLHLDINLQNKLETYSGADLAQFKAFCFDYNTQIYKDKEEFYIGYNGNGIRLTEDKTIVEVAKKSKKICFGDESAAEPIVLGTQFFDWFDSFMSALPTLYLGNLGAPCIPQPALAKIVGEYFAKKTNMLSKTIFAVDNFANFDHSFETITATGDSYEITSKESIINVEKIKEAEQQKREQQSEILPSEKVEEYNEGVVEKSLLSELIIDEDTGAIAPGIDKKESFTVDDYTAKMTECKKDETALDKGYNTVFTVDESNSSDPDQETWYDYEVIDTSHFDIIDEGDESWYDYDEATEYDPDYAINNTYGGSSGSSGGSNYVGTVDTGDKYINVTLQGMDFPDRPVRSDLNVSFTSEMKTLYKPIVDKLKLTKGMKLLITVMAQKEGFYKGSRSYRTNNPGNIGNTDSGANSNNSSLENGIMKQVDYVTKVAKGQHSAHKFGKKVIKPFYSKEIAKHRKSYKMSPYLPGYEFDYKGELAGFVKIYSTGARGGNGYLSMIISYFAANGVTITPHTTINEIINIV